MADRGDTHYRVGSLNRWFAVASLLLLAATFWMVIDDWYRPWKGYQREFRAMEVARAAALLEAPEAKAVEAEEQRLKSELEKAAAALAERQTELDEAQRDLRNFIGSRFKATEAEKKAKQVNNWERFLTEEERLHSGDQEAKAAELKDVEDELYERAGTKQEADAAVLVQEQRIAAMKAGVTQVEIALKNAGKSLELTRKKRDTLAPSDFPSQLANVIRDFPGLDFIGPSLKVQKVLPPDLTFELNFLLKPRIDMCQTCHVPIDREGFTEERNPFRTHPRLDLFLTAKSPHPQSQFGCTICHRGAGEALDFQRTDHRPSDEQEAGLWAEEQHWHKQHYWDYPMLPGKYVEASCVQCHKSSMDLIAADAPRMAEGFQLFERYGCYACHKVDWFPTKRRPGPSLARIAAKTTPEFIESWIENPKAFRPTTWMPQIFHLENYGPGVTVTHSNYGAGREMKGDEWSDAAIAAVSAFVRSRASDEALPAIPVAGDARRGREVFRLVGCLACHNSAPFTAEAREAEIDLASQRRVTNEHGPNLRGVASKVKPEWLYAWIKDPAAYWKETRMPDLRLTDQDAADVVAYIFDDPLFRDVPAGWVPEKQVYQRDVLEEQARWFFNRELRSELERRFQDEWKGDQEILVALGEKWVLGQGCHSCHEIPGLEDAQPIGTELTTWASKTVDKLDFGFLPEILADERQLPEAERHHFVEEFKQYRENFLEQKLHAPRSFDRRKIKNPSERLKMPWFNFSAHEIEAITCFVAGLVIDEVPHAKMTPAAEELAMDTGLRVVRQKNCAACHQLEPGQIEFKDDEGVQRSVHGQFLAFEGDVLPPRMQGFAEFVAKYEQDVAEIEEVVVQLLAPEPGLGEVGATILISDIDSIRATPAHGGDLVEVVSDYYLYPDDHHSDVEDVDGERRAYAEEAYDKVRWTFAPPVLWDEGGKVQREWFYQFLLDPLPLRQQIRVRMPSFNWAAGEAGAVADYFANRSQLDWPARYARKLQLQTGQSSAEVAAAMLADGRRTSAAVIQGIADGKPVETATGLEPLLRHGEKLGFVLAGPVDPDYEAVPQRSPGQLSPVLASDPEFFQKVHKLVTAGPNCVQCHFLRGAPPTQATPITWAPDLDLTRERLRPDWVREWLTDPSKIYPGTSMPANFPLDQEQWQEFYPAPSAQQIEAVLTWLYNLDRAVRN